MQTNEGRHSKSRTPPVTLGRTPLKKELRIPNDKLLAENHNIRSLHVRVSGLVSGKIHQKPIDLSNGVFPVKFALNHLIERRPPCRSIA